MAGIITDGLDAAFRNRGTGFGPESKFLPTPQVVKIASNNQLSERRLVESKAVFKRGSTGANVSFSTPEIRNPLLSLVNFYLPYDRRQLNQWIRYYDRFQPMVGNALDMHGEFPISDFRITGISDKGILDLFEEQKEAARLVDWAYEASREFDLIGECFTFFNWDETTGLFTEYVILNPDLLDFEEVVWGGTRRMVFSYEPPPELKSLIQDSSERVQSALNDIDPMVLDAVLNNAKIPLNEDNVVSLIRRSSPYDKRGTSIVLRCFVPGTNVWMVDGSVKPIEQVNVGDAVLNGEGNATTVTATHTNSGKELLFTIQDSLSQSLTATDDHEFFVVKAPARRDREKCPRLFTSSYCVPGRGKGACNPGSCDRFAATLRPVKVCARDLKVGDFLITPVPLVAPSSISIDPWLLGYFVGDGCRMGKWEVAFCGNNSIAGLMARERVFSGLKAFGVEKTRLLEQENYWRISICNKTLRKTLESLLGGLVAREKHLSLAVMGIPTGGPLESFIQGWFEADGTTVKEGTERVSTINKNLAWQLRFLLLRCGITSSVLKARNDYASSLIPCSEPRSIYSVRFRRGVAHRFSFENFCIDGWAYSRVRSVDTEEREATTHCVTVDSPDHSFLAEGKCVSNCIKDLLYEDKIREVQYAIADHHITPVQLWKLGDPASGYMPSPADLENFRALLQAGAHDPLFTIVSHAAVSLQLIGYTGQLLPVIPEFEWVEQRILTALYTNKAMTSGDGSGVQAGAVVAMKVIQGRYQSKRDKLRRAMIDRIYRPIAEHYGLYDVTQAELSHRVRRPNKERKLILPDIEWDFKLDLTDESQRIQFLVQLRQNSDMPMRTICEVLNIDYEKVKKSMKDEEGTPFDPVYRAARTASAENTGAVPGGVPEAAGMGAALVGAPGEAAPGEAAPGEAAPVGAPGEAAPEAGGAPGEAAPEA